LGLGLVSLTFAAAPVACGGGKSELGELASGGSGVSGTGGSAAPGGASFGGSAQGGVDSVGGTSGSGNTTTGSGGDTGSSGGDTGSGGEPSFGGTRNSGGNQGFGGSVGSGGFAGFGGTRGEGGTDVCPPCQAPPSPDCVGRGPCGCAPFECPDHEGACNNGNYCPGICVGTACDGEWACLSIQICTSDIAPWCGCDGETFYASSSCPSKAFAHPGECG
jgi:hypothetical protein